MVLEYLKGSDQIELAPLCNMLLDSLQERKSQWPAPVDQSKRIRLDVRFSSDNASSKVTLPPSPRKLSFPENIVITKVSSTRLFGQVLS